MSQVFPSRKPQSLPGGFGGGNQSKSGQPRTHGGGARQVNQTTNRIEGWRQGQHRTGADVSVPRMSSGYLDQDFRDSSVKHETGDANISIVTHGPDRESISAIETLRSRPDSNS